MSYYYELIVHIPVFRFSAFCISLLPVAGITSTEIKRCFGSLWALSIQKIQTRGSLSLGPCEKSGDGKLSKY